MSAPNENTLKTIFKNSLKLIVICCLTFQIGFTNASEEANNSDQSQISKLKELALNYQKEKKYKESIIIFQSLIKVQPQNLAIHLDLALSYFYNREFQAAKNQIDFVKSQPGFLLAPEEVVANVDKLYQSINERLADLSFKDPTFPSNKKIWDSSVSISGAHKSNATRLSSEQIDDQVNSNELTYQLFVNYKLIKPVENWRLDQSLIIYQLQEHIPEYDYSRSFTNLNYNIGYKKVLQNRHIFSSEMSAFLVNSASIKEPSIGLKIGYQINKHQFLGSTKRHWESQEGINPANDEETIVDYTDYWTSIAQYKGSYTWEFKENIDSLLLNWKTKANYIAVTKGYSKLEQQTEDYVRLEQQIGSIVQINDKISWTSLFQLRAQEFNNKEQLDIETRIYHSLGYEINKNWHLSALQQYKNTESTAAENNYNQWLYQLTLKWVN